MTDRIDMDEARARLAAMGLFKPDAEPEPGPVPMLPQKPEPFRAGEYKPRALVVVDSPVSVRREAAEKAEQSAPEPGAVEKGGTPAKRRYEVPEWRIEEAATKILDYLAGQACEGHAATTEGRIRNEVDAPFSVIKLALGRMRGDGRVQYKRVRVPNSKTRSRKTLYRLPYEDVRRLGIYQRGVAARKLSSAFGDEHVHAG